MNKRQTKKKKRNERLLCGTTYREDRKAMRDFHEYELERKRIRYLPEDIEILIELGIYTREEFEERGKRCSQKKVRHMQLRKLTHEPKRGW